jgi:hypothetical protein
MRIAALTGALAALTAGAAAAQSTAAGPVTIAPLVGYMKFDNGAALDNAPVGGLSATYRVKWGLSLGAFLEGARPTTLGDYFPAAILQTGGVSGRTQLFYVSQRVTLLNYGARAQYGFAVGGADAYVGVGLGQYTLFPDVQQENGVQEFSGQSWETGAGLGIALGENSGLRFDIRAVHFRKYDRSHLNAVASGSRNTRYPDVQDYPNVPKPGCAGPGTYCSVLNWRLGVAFVFYPQGAAR